MGSDAGVVVLGVDPGFANVGFALVRVTKTDERLIDLGLLRTEGSSKKLNVLAANDNFRRAREIALALHGIVTGDGRWPGADIIAAEAMSFPRNAASAAKIAMCWGVLASLCELQRLPLVQPSPVQVKAAVCNTKSASKSAVRDALRVRFERDLLILDEMEKLLGKSSIEHPYDALGTVVASLSSEAVQAARRMLSG